LDGDGRMDVLSVGIFAMSWYQNTMCPRGSFGPGGYAPCSPCPPGRFGNTSLLEVCGGVCPAGRFGSGGSTNESCSGPCAAGFACAAGSANATAAACLAGKYSLAGAGACSDALVPYTITNSALGAWSVRAADLDGDGRMDVLSASGDDDKVVWYRNGGGAPLSWTAYTIADDVNFAISVHAADLDGDGRLDVLSASAHDDKIAWYRNGGGVPGVWTPFTISTTADHVVSVYAADLDGDGRLDVMSASFEDDKIAWYKNGGGSPLMWTPRTIFSAADGAYSVYAADLDSDGRLDVLSAGMNDDTIAWYRNDGGSPVVWTPYNITTTANGAQSVYAADVDGDGRADVLSASYLDSRIAWYKNTWNGAAVAWTLYTITMAADGAASVFAADVDGDGLVDVVSASQFDDKVAWYKNGGGSPMVWTPFTLTTTADFAMSVYAADVDGDGRVDVLSAHRYDNKVAWYRNLMCPRGSYGPGGYAPCSPCPPGRFGNTSLLEVCAACPAGRYSLAGAASPQACVACPAKATCAGGGPTGPCGVGYLCPVGSTTTPSATTAACFASGSTTAVWSGNGTCRTLVTQAGAAFGPLVVAGLCTGFDVQCNDGDAVARLPAAVAAAGFAAGAVGSRGGVFVLANGSAVAVDAASADGYMSAQVQPSGLPPASRFTVACVVDLDADGAEDVVLGGAVGTSAAVLMGSATGQGLTAGAAPFGNSLSSALGAGGVSALVAVALGPGCPVGASVIAATPAHVVVVRLALVGGSQVSTFTNAMPSGADAVGLAVADLDGDGAMDALACTTTGQLLLASGLCSAFPAFVAVGALPGPCSGLAVGDADGDGDMDAFASGAAGVNNTLWLNSGRGVFAAALGLALGVGPVAPVFVDVNGDGRMDVPAVGHLGVQGPLTGGCLCQGCCLTDLCSLGRRVCEYGRRQAPPCWYFCPCAWEGRGGGRMMPRAGFRLGPPPRVPRWCQRAVGDALWGVCAVSCERRPCSSQCSLAGTVGSPEPSRSHCVRAQNRRGRGAWMRRG
jgi:hypothetical protein